MRVALAGGLERWALLASRVRHAPISGCTCCVSEVARSQSAMVARLLRVISSTSASISSASSARSMPCILRSDTWRPSACRAGSRARARRRRWSGSTFPSRKSSDTRSRGASPIA
eukprot:scaffold19007_cov71-Phaeocystis_antarctica.AAC.3